jgi:hypothetical protein
LAQYGQPGFVYIMTLNSMPPLSIYRSLTISAFWASLTKQIKAAKLEITQAGLKSATFSVIVGGKFS